MTISINVDPHPLLHIAWFALERHTPPVHNDAQATSAPWLVDLLRIDARSPFAAHDAIRPLIRELLRFAGYKPTGRGKPASEYLAGAAAGGSLETISPAVDVCNVVSLHSGFPISLVDLDLLTPPLRIGVGEPGARYVFNPSGQEINLEGLLCLFDASGPIANPVKDSQRTKTSIQTMRALTIIWGRLDLAERLEQAASWYRELASAVGWGQISR